ncbi:filamentous hemagglutinin N-terminal domain-containing protein [Nostoc sp. FACHB-152]|uniref:two-partner secretion domain-containing protein n=1 Tax=unclassified Nostoc TaxID=2593658 RepID=UPI00168822A7|nr:MULTISPECIES: filamentous hemagglutinin N-terminal domain-containing protein [unclassified Nostoc]MBD2448596.1 filamentous hemagglutinin N-terminal domain-containing protein [Nostoc sp. FACHB-152]MBD2469936.1 filamentous hemagglutinin N-terminal domain-containing protein [Nostoc sp. FACHB-145]
MARKWFVFLCYLQTFLRLRHRYPLSLADQEQGVGCRVWGVGTTLEEDSDPNGTKITPNPLPIRMSGCRVSGVGCSEERKYSCSYSIFGFLNFPPHPAPTGLSQQEEKGQATESRGEDQSKRRYLSWVKTGFSTTTQLLGILIFTNTTCIGQITPDTTLGTESSQVNSHVMIRGLEGDRIDGGAVRGSALFHSFSEFNVNDGQRVYFSNPAGITNIFTRVTGADISRIFGTLGVDGSANLFLLNPQGIKFGSNAQLDIQGSFVASTANSFVFPDGSEFSAKNPKAPPLLTMSATPGVQWGASGAGGTITNQGNLTVGEDLTLLAGNLDLQGQLHALRDLTLFAEDNVKVRDSVTNPFMASAGRNFTVQGNSGIDILALNHPTQTPFVSGGNLSFSSDGKISLDAHFSSGGNFAISPVSGGLANFVSLYDPIISANGDVDVAASYTGTSLLVEATGNIRFQGDINITGADNNSLPTGPDTETLTKNSTLILRSGQSTLAYGGVNSGNVFSYSNGTVPEGITLDGDVVLQPFNGTGGIVSLTAASGDVNTQLISTNGQRQKDDLDTLSDDAIAIGGAISIEATTGSVDTGHLLSYSKNSNLANGGAIALTAGGNITTYYIFSNSFDGNGGAIALTAGGHITTNNIDSYSFSFGSGNGGEIALTAGGHITTNNINSSSLGSGNGGEIALTTDGHIITNNIDSHSLGNGGEIALTAGGHITTNNIYSYSLGNGGEIALTASGNITTNNIYSASYVNGGAITLTAGGHITTNNIDSYSLGNDGGVIALTAGGNITAKGDFNSFSHSESGNSGTGGAIFLSAKNGDIVGNRFKTYIYDYSQQNYIEELRNPMLNSFSVSQHGTAGKGGNVTIQAKNNVSNLDILTLSSSAEAGKVQIKGFGDLSLTNTQIVTSGQLLVKIPDQKPIPLEVGKVGQSGDVTIKSFGSLTFKNSRIESDTKSSASAGNVMINSPGLVTFNSSQITANTSTQGNGGNINITAHDSIILTDNSKLSAETTSSGKAGSVSIITPTLNINSGTQVSTNTTSQEQNAGTGGNLTVSANTINLAGMENLTTGLFAQTAGAGIAGKLTLNPYSGHDLQVQFQQPGAEISASTTSSGIGGNLELNAPNSITLSGDGQLTVESKGTGNGGSISIHTRQLTIEDHAKISASGENTGKGGSIDIQAEKLKLDRGEIISESKQSEAGNINLKLNNLLLLRHNSTISTSAGTQHSKGNGGNIEINVKDGFVIADPSENSDIIANAYGGNGGKINMRANRILGFQLQGREALDNIRKNRSSDISASSDVGTQGQVTVENLNVDPSQGLVQLSTQLIDPTKLIASGCGGNSHTAKGQSEFVITGRGGLPPSPDDTLTAGTAPTTWVTSKTPALSNNARNTPVVNSNDVSSSVASAPLVEAQGMIRDANGEIIFTAQPPVNTLHQSALPAQFCHLTQK